MRCAAARRRISDGLDGALAFRRCGRLEAHLRSCPACRRYRDDLKRLQAGTRKPEDPPASYWTDFERRLEARLDREGESRPRPVRLPLFGRRLAWAGAAGLLLVGAALWFALARRGPALTEAWVDYDDVLDPVVLAAEANPDLAAKIDLEIQASIAEAAAPSSGEEAVVLPAADPLFWEGLSDAELEAVVKELEKDTGRGGPK